MAFHGFRGALCWAITLAVATAGFAQTSTPPDAPLPTSGLDSNWLAQAGSRGVRAHDPSTIVPCKDEFWVFYTGQGVPSYRSKDLVTWTAGPRAFTNPPPWVATNVPANRNGMDFWAPDVIHLGDRYFLYYSVSSFGKNTSAIALATNPTLDPADPGYRWTDQGVVIRSGTNDDFNAIDPAITRDAAGNLWLAFGSFWSGIRMVQLDPQTGKRLAPDSPNHLLAHHASIEAACLCRHDNRYYLFLNWGMCCRGVNSTYSIRVGRSDNISGPYLDREGKDLALGGGSLVLGTKGPFIGPGHAGIVDAAGTNWLSCHFYDGTRHGMPTLALLPLRWAPNGWPEVELPPLRPPMNSTNAGNP